MKCTIGPFRFGGWEYQLFPRHAMMLTPDGLLMMPANCYSGSYFLHNDGWQFVKECV